ncbi:hypothetical protein BU24DRAFT_104098 [Aaosphaeria arxii CBS 175.79]|uniref:RING-type domain-containing protein n=1 Tax=Aaosphaeria arxii CBS 175.79 TaxID=1450172 RepID=A0A6A5Y1E7_9PLEO|nr:uncharacterized protein BU24DRAFT_104098 [Aaosphaeria arxii CBS 175.79]KAF2018741.1 hypothetical protein BU24DRAFT_104098 [Aaosphaeria arxii CBS 175.79]
MWSAAYRDVVELLSEEEGINTPRRKPKRYRPDSAITIDSGSELEDIAFKNDTPLRGSPPSQRPSQAAVSEIGDMRPSMCLQKIVEIFPDISKKYALELIDRHGVGRSLSQVAMENLLSRIIEGGKYPKEEEESHSNDKKRKRASSNDSDTEGSIESIKSPYKYFDALDLLKDEFPAVPALHIEKTWQAMRSLSATFATLSAQLRDINSPSCAFRKLKKARQSRGYERKLRERGGPVTLKVIDEFDSARKRARKEESKLLRIRQLEEAEERNLSMARQRGEVGECQCCFADFPFNRMTCCNGDTIHFFCRDCTKRYVESEIGSMRCTIVCFADTNCGGTFRRQYLLDSLSQSTFERLEHLQQQADLAAANLDFLEECPFCDFKMECLPIEVDREFRCEAPKCRKVSCRACQKETHVPMTCEEARKEEKLNLRHTIEEAKSQALIRKCNKCSNPFIKEYGCNKMTCGKCGNMQCYVCSKNVAAYDHFGGEGCPLHDNIEERHEEDIRKAEDEAMRKIRAENPDITEEDLKILSSDRVLKAEAERKQQAQARHDNFRFHMDGNQLRAREALFLGGPVAGAPAPVAARPAAARPPPPPPPPPPHPYPAVQNGQIPHYVPVWPAWPLPHMVQPVAMDPQGIPIPQPPQPQAHHLHPTGAPLYPNAPPRYLPGFPMDDNYAVAYAAMYGDGLVRLDDVVPQGYQDGAYQPGYQQNVAPIQVPQQNHNPPQQPQQMHQQMHQQQQQQPRWQPRWQR